MVKFMVLHVSGAVRKGDKPVVQLEVERSEVIEESPLPYPLECMVRHE
jgi:hypothetical protein